MSQSILDKVGIEIEGEFAPETFDALMNLGDIAGDGSVRMCTRATKHEHLTTREFRSNPYILLSKFEEIFDILATEKGQLWRYHWNDSAGFHIHVSFKDGAGNRVTEPPEIISVPFYLHFLRELKKDFPEVWKKRHNNNYCAVPHIKETDNEFDLEIIRAMFSTRSARYQAFNVYQSIQKNGTMEFRIWPSAEPAEMKRYLFWTINLVKNWLANEENHKMSLEVDILPDEIKKHIVEHGEKAGSLDIHQEFGEIAKVGGMPRYRELLRKKEPRRLSLTLGQKRPEEEIQAEHAVLGRRPRSRNFLQELMERNRSRNTGRLSWMDRAWETLAQGVFHVVPRSSIEVTGGLIEHPTAGVILLTEGGHLIEDEMASREVFNNLSSLFGERDLQWRTVGNIRLVEREAGAEGLIRILNGNRYHETPEGPNAHNEHDPLIFAIGDTPVVAVYREHGRITKRRVARIVDNQPSPFIISGTISAPNGNSYGVEAL